MNKEQIKMKYIANQLGVSISTVSRALRGKPGVGKELAEKIKANAEKLDYTTSMSARGLRMGKMDVLGILVSDNSEPYFARIIKGIEDTAKKMDYTVIVSNTNQNSKTEAHALSRFRAMSLAGILAVPIDPANYAGVNLPLVFLSRVSDESAANNVSFVINDDYKGAYMATQHLIDRDCKTVYFVGYSKTLLPAQKRLKGYSQALEDNLIHLNDKMVIDCDITTDGGYQSVKTLLKSNLKVPFGLMCFNDNIAIGTIKAVKEKNLRIPEDVKIIGYNDIEILPYIDPPLSTIKQARYMIGVLGAEYIISEIEGNNSYKSRLQKILEPELIIRNST